MKGRLSYAEIGILAGFLLGLILLGTAWFFSKTADAKFCIFETEESGVCVRFISLYPFVLALLGLLIGFIADKIDERDEARLNRVKVKINVR